MTDINKKILGTFLFIYFTIVPPLVTILIVVLYLKNAIETANFENIFEQCDSTIFSTDEFGGECS